MEDLKVLNFVRNNLSNMLNLLEPHSIEYDTILTALEGIDREICRNMPEPSDKVVNMIFDEGFIYAVRAYYQENKHLNLALCRIKMKQYEVRAAKPSSPQI